MILSGRDLDQVEEAYTHLQLQYSDDPQGGIVLKLVVRLLDDRTRNCLEPKLTE